MYCVLQLRWVVESVNGRLKTWSYLSRTIPNTKIPHIGDYVRIVSAICNKFRPDLSTGIEEEDVAMAAKMRFLANGVNELKDYVETFCILIMFSLIDMAGFSKMKIG